MILKPRRPRARRYSQVRAVPPWPRPHRQRSARRCRPSSGTRTDEARIDPDPAACAKPHCRSSFRLRGAVNKHPSSRLATRAASHGRRHRICRYPGQGPSENLAYPQQAVSNVLAAMPLRIQGLSYSWIPIHARRDARRTERCTIWSIRPPNEHRPEVRSACSHTIRTRRMFQQDLYRLEEWCSLELKTLSKNPASTVIG
jgi:hypothetical protein